MSEIYFIRHAQASFGDNNYDKLSRLGIRQAQILGDYFADRGVSFHSVYSGTMKRQIETAERVLSAKGGAVSASGVGCREAFNEYDFAAVLKSQIPLLVAEDPSLSKTLPHMHSDPKAFQAVFKRAITKWVHGQQESGVETYQGFSARVQKGVFRLMEETGPQKKIAVFTSGGCISLLMQMALSLSAPKTVELSWQIRNASVSIFKYNRKQIGLYTFNSTAHLDLHNDNELLTYR